MVSDEPVGEARIWERWSPSSSSKLGWSMRRRRRRRDIRAPPVAPPADRGGSGVAVAPVVARAGGLGWGGACRRADLGALMKIRGAGKG